MSEHIEEGVQEPIPTIAELAARVRTGDVKAADHFFDLIFMQNSVEAEAEFRSLLTDQNAVSLPDNVVVHLRTQIDGLRRQMAAQRTNLNLDVVEAAGMVTSIPAALGLTTTALGTISYLFSTPLGSIDFRKALNLAADGILTTGKISIGSFVALTILFRLFTRGTHNTRNFRVSQRILRALESMPKDPEKS